MIVVTANAKPHPLARLARFAQIKNHSALHTLDLSHNSIGTKGANAIASALDHRWPLVRGLTKFVLNNNNLTSRGTAVLCEVGQATALHCIA